MLVQIYKKKLNTIIGPKKTAQKVNLSTIVEDYLHHDKVEEKEGRGEGGKKRYIYSLKK